jgi:integrase
MPASSPPRLCRVAGRDAWHIYDSRRRVSTGSPNRAEAELVLANFLRERNKPQLAVVSIGLILDRYLYDRRDRAIPGVARLEYAHKPLQRALGSKPPEVVSDAECRRYVAGRRRDGVAVTTIRTELQALRAALRWAAKPEVGLIAAAPVITMPPRPESRVRWLTREEATRLLTGCRAHHVHLFVTVALHTGARSGAILALTWDRVDMINRTIDFREPGRAQTRKRRVLVPINDTLHAALTQAHRISTADSVIEWAGGPVTRIKHAFRDAVARAGLSAVSPHVLRHTAVTWQLQAGIPPWEVAGFVGMTVEMVQDVYGHHHPDHLRRAARALG